MLQQFVAYYERVKGIGDNPFWATARSRSARTPWWKQAWRIYAGYTLLLMLPLGLLTYGFSLDQQAQDNRNVYAAVVCGIGVFQLLYLSVKASLSTAPSVVQARQQGTLLALALTRINSADFADGVALSESKNLVHEFIVWSPALLLATLLAGQSVYSTVVLVALSLLCILYFAYNGILISATSKDSREAGRRASQSSVVMLGGSALGFLCGGFMLGPLWFLHPLFAYGASMWGAGSPTGATVGSGMSMVFWCGWSALVLPIYAWFVLNVRRSAIRALERVRIA